MMESIVRRERLETPPSTSPCYVWAVPQKPVSVRLGFELIDRMEREAVENFRSLTSRGSEIGGLLLGAVSPGSPAVVTVEDYEMVECDQSRGPLYRLSDADLGRFERAIEQRGAGGGPRVVGFFRSHTRKGVSLDAEDLAFFEARFRDPHNIALLIRPFATKASVGAIFIWEDGTVRGDASYQEFPFRSAQLPSGAPAAAPRQPDAPESGPAAAAAPAPAAPKPAARAQIVPIATRREIVMPPPAAVPPPAATPAPEPPVKNNAAEAPAKAAEPERAAAPAAAIPAAESAQKTPAPPPAPAAEPEFMEPPARAGKLPWIAGGAAAALLVPVLLFVYPGFLHRGSRPPAPAVASRQDSSPLSLRVERTANELLLTWNRDADVIQNAQTAQLSISDGDRQENYKMGLEEIRKGSIVYMPLTPDVSFRMEVMNQRGEKTGSELVRVLRSSPMPDAATPAPAQAAAKPDGAAPPNPAAENQPPAGTDNTPKPTPAPLKPFRMESLAQRLRPAQSEDVPDAPALGGMAAAGGPAPPSLGVNAAMPAPPVGAISAPAAPPAPPERKAAPQTGGRIQQARLIFRKEPEYPRLARQTGIKGAVEVQATIGTDGKVKSVKVLRGHPMLQKAAVDAVMQWVYKPTLLNGVAVESQTLIVLNFIGER